MSVPRPQQKICLFGGTFDPIHLGHTHIAHSAVKQLQLDRVIFLPCRQSPHKTNRQHASTSDRLAMCQLAVSDLPWAEVDTHDLISPPPSYSWRTAGHMHAQHPDARLFWLMGTDQWQALPRWHHPERLAELVEFIVFTREHEPSPREGFRMHSVQGHHPASATSIRQTLPTQNASSWLSPKVQDYIQQHQLYSHT